MEQYISKSALVAEINRVLNSYDPNEITSGRYALVDLRNFINTLEVKEEPVSVWHNMDEVPIKGEVILVQTKDSFYGVSVQKGGTTYKNKNKDRYVKWAYRDDILNLSNVERTANDLKEVRVQAAIAAMQGVMNFFGSIDYNKETIAKLAVEQADSLIEELKKK